MTMSKFDRWLATNTQGRWESMRSRPRNSTLMPSSCIRGTARNRQKTRSLSGFFQRTTNKGRHDKHTTANHTPVSAKRNVFSKIPAIEKKKLTRRYLSSSSPKTHVNPAPAKRPEFRKLEFPSKVFFEGFPRSSLETTRHPSATETAVERPVKVSI